MNNILRGAIADATHISEPISKAFKEGFFSITCYTDDTYTTPVSPSSGTITITVTDDSFNYTPIHAGAVNVTNPDYTRPTIGMAIERFKVNIVDVTGATHFIVKLHRLNVPSTVAFQLHREYFNGRRALNVQSYTEANVKLGVQFEASLFKPDLTAGGSIAAVFITGAKPISMKAIQIAMNGSGVTLQLFKNPVYSGGNAITVFNLTELSPIATSVTIFDAVVVTNAGTAIAAPLYYIGSTQPGISAASTTGVVGLERMLAPNTTYLIRGTSRDSASSDISNYMTWYEGEPDLSPVT